MLAGALLAVLGSLGLQTGAGLAQSCPPHCPTPIVTPAWHLHMCDQSYQEQLDDNHCMHGDGVTEFPEGADQVYIIYCHRAEDLVVVQVRDAAGGLQYVNHPDGITYVGNACETLVYARRNGIPAAGSPYYTSAYWPEGPFHGVSRGVAWYVGLFVAFDQEIYYGNAAEAFISARDPAAGEDPTVAETIAVTVTSTSDPLGIALTLREEAPGLSLFRAVRPVRFSTVASDEARGVLKVANRDTLTVAYCPRNCATPYTDTATWYQLIATVTPTPLPTYGGPPPTPTATPPPDVRMEYLTLRPAPDDVGYVPQILTNRGLPNHLGYPSIYAGMWTRGQNLHYGMVQFDLGALPTAATIMDARLEMVGRDDRFTEPGAWSVQLLDPAIDGGWRLATFEQVRDVTVLAQIGPTLDDGDLRAGRTNSFGFAPAQLGFLNARLRGTQRVSFRIDGPAGPDENLFAWQSGVDKYHRDPDPPDPSLGPALSLAYARLAVTPTSTARDTPAASATAVASVTTAPTGSATPVPTLATAPWPTWPTPTVTSDPSATRATPGATATLTLTPGGPAPPAPTATPSPTSTGEPPPSPTDGPLPTATDGPGPGATATAIATPSRSPSPWPTGPAEQRQVCLAAFDDLDGDGRRDPEERFLPGVTVQLTHLESGAFVTWTTDGRNDPDYCWSGLTDGDYSLGVVDVPWGYRPTGAAEHVFAVPFAGPPAYFAFGLRLPDRATATATSPGPTGSPPPTALVTGTVTPPPSRTPTPSVTPTPTITPTPTPQPTVVGPSGDICLAVYDDADGSGFHEPVEPLLADVLLTIRDRDRAVVRALRSRPDGLVCARLGVGIYYAGCALLPGREATTIREKAILLTEQQRQIVEFGQRLLPPRTGIYLPLADR